MELTHKGEGTRSGAQRDSSGEGKKKAFSEEVMFEEVILESNTVLKTYHPSQELEPRTLEREGHLKAWTFRRV